MEIQKCDVLIIGGGCGGLKASVEARKLGAEVVLIQKGRLGESGSTAYGVSELAGYAAADGAGDPEDNPEVHYNDIIKAANGTADEKIVRIYVKEAIESVNELREIGVDFTKYEKGEELIAQGCFASKPRNRKIQGHGHPISKKLGEQAQSLGVKVFENTMAIDLVISKEECVGVTAILPSGERIFFNSISTILATGGAGQLFEWNLNPLDITGDGYAMGYRAGANFSNLEFIQAGFGTVEPFYSLVNTWLWSTLPRLINENGEDVLKKYLPSNISTDSCMRDKARHFPFSSADNSKYLEISALLEYKQTENCPLLDLSNSLRKKIFNNPWEEKMLKITYEYFKEKGLDISTEPIKINVFEQAINGGMVIDEYSETTIPSLFAVGECSAGPYGADRLGGNMLPFCQVFGKKAGQTAAYRTKTKTQISPNSKEINNSTSVLDKLETINESSKINDLYNELRKISTPLLILRNEKDLLKLLSDLSKMKEKMFSRSYKGETLVKALELNNLISTAKLMAKFALYRKESRGSHYREDFPSINEKYSKRIYIARNKKEELDMDLKE